MMAAVTTGPADSAGSAEEAGRGGASHEPVSLRDLYVEQRWTLVRLASLLLHDQAEAEEAVQDAFVKTHVAWRRLRDPDKATAYLRSAVLNAARSRLRHRRVVERADVAPGPGRSEQSVPSPEHAALTGEDRRRMVAALRTLPGRQAECLVLRYYLDLTEAETAITLGISSGSVKTHVHRGLATLAQRVERSS